MKKKMLACFMASIMGIGTLAGMGAFAEEAQEPVTITMWWPGSGDSYEALATQLADLVHEKYDWITVDTLVIPWADYDSKMNVAFAGGTAPDIFGVGLNTLPTYVQTGNLQKMSEVLDDSWDGWTDIPENIQQYASYEDAFYGVMMCDLRPFMWRKDLFEAAGLDPDTPPANAEELFEYAQKLTEYDENGKVKTAGFQIQTSGYVDQTLFAAMLMFGLDEFWDEEYNLTIQDPKMIQAVEYCKSFIDEGLCNYSEGIATTAFSDGTAAMTLNTACNELGNLEDTIGFDNIGVAAPFMEDQANFVGGTIVCVNNQAKNMDAVMKAYEVMTSKEGCEICGLTAGFCPPRESALDAYVAQNPDIYGPIAEILPYAKSYGDKLNPCFADFRDILKNYMEQIYYGKMDVEEGLQSIVDDYKQAQQDWADNM
ncbi:MAG TPA: extracellular solute-binding protein [Candidatus Limivivens intestinipullorum]|uniref:Extracellular solute-binding protein n=1 Tax=Candidatus Limivivens intestinipullorum TaxID=2840858 RepID=A0A9D1JIK0_9FIRM|nr:extracellular solute-binding protein [Candidatus Limivivens intestinipullorum]